MKIKFALILCTLLVDLTVSAQRPGTASKVELSATVVDGDTGSGLEFATVTILSKKDTSIIDGALTGPSGMFSTSLVPGDYFARVEFISYQTIILETILFPEDGSDVNLGTIRLVPESTVLEDVVITADRSETVFALDKRVFTVGKDLANRGGSAEDILDNVPSVTVDIDGNVALRGSSGVRILINGRPSGLAGLGNANGLRNIAANMIEKVEVITNPSARYEAEGMAGIINIILKKNENSGFNGSFDLTGGYPSRNGASANLNYRKNNINWFVNYGVNHNENPGGGYNVQDQSFIDETSMSELRRFTELDRSRLRSGLSNSLRLGLDVFFTEKDQLTGSLLYRKSDDENESTLIFEDYIAEAGDFDFAPLWDRDISDLVRGEGRDIANTISDDLLYSVTNRTDNEFEDELDFEYNLNYRKEFSSREHNLNTSLQFRESTETEGSELESQFRDDLPGAGDPLKQRSNNTEGQENWLFQVDYVHPLGKDHKWEAGLRSSFRTIQNDYIVEEEVNGSYIPLAAFTNNFVYDEDIQAAYGIYGNTFGKFSYQMGLRYEYSLINTRLLQSENGAENKREYSNLFPSGFLNYNFSEEFALQASYSRRINRPGFWTLNPFFTFSDNRNFFSGNPNIDPEYTDSYEIGQIFYLDNLSFSGSFFMRHTDASIQRVLIADKVEATTLRVPINIGTINDYGLDISVNFSGLEWLRLDGNCNIFRNQLNLTQEETDQEIYNYYTTARNYEGSPEDFSSVYDYNLNETDNITWNGRITARITVWDSDLQIRTNYRGGQQTSQGNSNAVATVDLGWSKDLLKEKNLTVTISVRDLFNSRRRNGFTLLDNFFQESEWQWRARTASATISYRINQKKSKGGDRSGDYGGGGGGEF